jgi:hypothetical protein
MMGVKVVTHYSLFQAVEFIYETLMTILAVCGAGTVARVTGTFNGCGQSH